MGKNIMPTKMSFVGKLPEFPKVGFLFFAHFLYHTACRVPRNMLHKCHGERLFQVPVTYLEMKRVEAKQHGASISFVLP